ncbi:MAG: AAA family ATPase [Bryobacterales bacterium]|nr:AAA family ATPase [Bryobacterales bacterium]
MAGPNGSGKSSLSASLTFENSSRIIDPDAIARTLDPDRPDRAAISAARAAVTGSKDLLRRRESFILETTLAGNGALARLREAKLAGYRTLLVYLALRTAELHIERVRLRVSQGGHDVPDVDIRRRYERSLIHAPEAMRLADEAVVFDNSGTGPERMLTVASGRITWRARTLPAWVLDLAARL